jgi:hypothetical protein
MKQFYDAIGEDATGDITVNLELPEGAYQYRITDHLGNTQMGPFTIGTGGTSFVIAAADLPDRWLNRYRGHFILEVLDLEGSKVPFKMKGSFDRVLFSVVGDEITDDQIGLAL